MLPRLVDGLINAVLVEVAAAVATHCFAIRAKAMSRQEQLK